MLLSGGALGACVKPAGDTDSTNGDGGATAGAAATAGVAGTDTGASGGGGSGGRGGAGEGGGAGAPIVLVDCSSRDVSGALVVTGEVGEDQDWSGVVRIQGAVSVLAVTLRIAAGTRVIFDAESSLEIGWNRRAATILAQGTNENPIRMCGSEGTPGHWGSLIVGSDVTADSVLSNVLIADGGSPDGAALVLNGAARIDQVQVRNAGGEGVRASAFGEGSQDLVVESSAKSALVLTTPLAVTRAPSVALLDNGEDVARLRMTEFAEPIHFKALGVPYVQEEDVWILAVEATFDAGVDYRFAAGKSLEVGFNTRRALLRVAGTERAPVVFQGLEPRAGYWGGLQVRSSVDAASVVSHARVLHGGADDQPALLIESPIELADVQLDTNQVGARVAAAGLGESSTNLSITRTAGPPLTVAPDALISIPEGGSFTGNEDDVVAVLAGDYVARGTVSKLDVPYRVLGNVQTLTDSSLTIQPGTTFLMNEGATFSVAFNTRTGAIQAVGTAAAPIVFRGATEQSGHWGALVIGAAVTAGSRLDHVQIGHGGGSPSSRANLVLLAPIPVTNSRFFASAGYGILKRADDTSDYAATNSFEMLASGNVGTL